MLDVGCLPSARGSIQLLRMEIRTVHGSVTAGAPAPSLPDEGAVVAATDVYFSWRPLDLRMAFEAKIVVALD